MRGGIYKTKTTEIEYQLLRNPKESRLVITLIDLGDLTKGWKAYRPRAGRNYQYRTRDS